ncbi:MAG: SusF/SusE family outer membrane protein [Prevotellaceae bacterium]|jgi:hypothetical protein|nr:SusF/SusE family outer membrane protein [Prevotellaceae bacterium]
MKSINFMRFINKTVILATSCLLLFACDSSDDESIKGDPLTLIGPAEKVVLLESNASATAVTFTWNKGIERNPTDTVTYIFRIDIANRDFTTATPRDTVAGFSKSFTAGELNELIAEQWKIRLGEEIDLEARVVANVRGEKFVYPEIAVAKFTVVTYTYASVPLYLVGSANPESNPVRLTETVNGSLYKWQGDLNAGGFKLLYNPDSDLPSLNKGVDNTIMVERTAASQPDDLFTIEHAGFYTINVNRKNMQIACKYIQYYFPEIYPVGSATSIDWGLGSLKVPWDDDNPGIYVYEGPLTEGELKIHTDTGWGGCFRPMEANGSISSTEVQYTYRESDRGDLKWYVQGSDAGNYRITLDVSEMKIYFEKL